MNAQNDMVNVLYTDHTTKSKHRINPYAVVVVVIVLLSGGLYYANSYQPEIKAKSAIEQIQVQADPQTQTSTEANISPRARKQQTKENTDLINSLASMQARQRQRDTQIKAYLQSARAPDRVPDLPVIAPLETPQTALNLQRIQDQYDINKGQTLPKSVMDKFTTETGLTQAEIEQAMNQ